MENIVTSFRAIADRMPDAQALIFKGKSYTYRDLDHQSDSIAAYLQNRQMKGKQVGVAMNREQEWIVVLLGIWKAGAVYVPLDLNHPRERLESIIADCGIVFVVGSRGSSFHPDNNVPFCYADELLNHEEKAMQPSLPDSADRAYIIYTSGTSGEPKGIPICHRQAVNMSQIAKEHCFYIDSGDKILQLAGLNFSASLVEILTALLNGACMVMASDKERHDPVLLVDLIEREKVCSGVIPPALLAVFPKVPLERLETLVVAGEGVATDVKDFWMKGRRMVNAYGFSENTVIVTNCIYTEKTPANDIGTLVPGTMACVLDEDLNPVPDGVPGELCVAGTQLTEGYWNRPDLNERKFIRNPFSTNNKNDYYSRLYRSGDKVVRLVNGHFLYMGRLDHQVKIRGMRVELSEVEQCLNHYPGVSGSVVLLREHAGKKRLVAYLQADKEISREKIAAFIAQKLPDYMRPTAYMTLSNFPMTINRKIDRTRLPEPDWDFSYDKEHPATSTEKEIARLWQKQLGVSAIGRYDNFISLGGDSISVLMMTGTLEEAFGIKLNGEDVFARLDLHILAQFIEQVIADKSEDTGKIIPESGYNFCPLPPALRNLWSQCISSEEMNEAYKLAIFLPWSSDLDIDSLQKAWNRIVEEQETMRMSFLQEDNGEPYIYIAPFFYTDILIYDLKEADDLWKEAQRLYLPAFRLKEGPLHRVCLYRHPNGESVLAVIIHHLVTDGWSLRILSDKLRTYYKCAMQDEPFPVEGHSYREYAVWQKEHVDSRVVEQRKSFWKQYLFGCPSLHLEGKTDNIVSTKSQGSAKYIPLESDLGKQLEEYCKHHEITPFVACLSVFQLLLMKYVGQTDFAVGIAVTDRKQIEFRNLLGYFVTLLPVRTVNEKEKGFVHYSKKIMQVMVKLLINSLPLNHILASMEGNTAHEQPAQPVRFAFGLEESPSDLHVPEEWITSSPLDMLLIMHKREGNYSLHFQYATACFDGQFITQFAESFQIAMRFLLSQPSRNMLECPLLSEDKIAGQISTFTFSEASLPSWNVIQRFDEIATVQPECDAYAWSDFRMSYGELDKISNLVAIVVRRKFDIMDLEQKNPTVGIYLKDKKYLIPAIMGVLKSGGCYVPLDPSLPIERLLFILKDASISLLLIDESYRYDLPCETLLISEAMKEEYPVAFHSIPSVPEDAAYIIYTSGSTGTPKGVPISHLSLALFVNSMSNVYQFQSGKRVLQYANAGFDISVMEIFLGLTTGVTLVVPTEEERKDCYLLLDLLEREKIYFASIPPALLSLLPYRLLPHLQMIAAGGESTPFDVMTRWMQGRRLFNIYGPTENTVLTTFLELSDGFVFNDIGTPLPGVSCYVLDDNMTFMPDYVPGELYIGGLQLTAGYMNREELNQEKFVENPYVSPEDKKAGINMRLYKSGDKVMRTSEGHFIFLGRVDSQVKLRGFRIELEEIAKRLEEYPGITQAVVLLKEYKNEKRIVAYLLAEDMEEVKLDKIRGYLTDYLPSYMIPSAWSILTSFPMTINGKVDRKALPDPELLISEDYEPPVNQEEKELAKIAARLLQLPRIGVCTDLLAMGLSSLQIMEFVHDAMEKQVYLSVTDIYKGKSIRKILAGREKALFFWGNEPKPSKPVIVLICGYPTFKPFYDHFIELFEEHYSFFVFESFLEYYRNKRLIDANELVSDYRKVVETELEGREIYAVMGYCLGGELAMLLAEQLQSNGHPSIKALIIDGFIRRDKTLLVPPAKSNKQLSDEGRIANRIIETLPEPSFGGEIIICLAGKASTHFMFETDAEDDDELMRRTWEASQRNVDDWNDCYPQTDCHILDADHFSVFDDAPLSAICEIVKRNWNIH